MAPCCTGRAWTVRSARVQPTGARLGDAPIAPRGGWCRTVWVRGVSGGGRERLVALTLAVMPVSDGVVRDREGQHDERWSLTRFSGHLV